LKSLKEKLPYHENIVRFITQQSLKEPTPDLRRRTIEECSDLLTKEKFLKINDSFDYLLDLPIRSLTLKNAQKHEKDLVDLREKIKILESTTPSKMWLDDLNNLSLSYC
jgi:DNA topoisomerase-2